MTEDDIRKDERIKVLRELAAGLFPNRFEMVCETEWTKHWREARLIFKEDLLKKADALEAIATPPPR